MRTIDIDKYRDGLVCLVPIEGKSGITCHEKTLCDCQVLEIFEVVDELRKQLDFNLQRELRIINKYEDFLEDKKQIIKKYKATLEKIATALPPNALSMIARKCLNNEDVK